VKVLFDTSVLVAALIVSHPHHPACYSQLRAAKSKQFQGFISTHSLAETYSVITRFPIQPRIAPFQAQSIIAVGIGSGTSGKAQSHSAEDSKPARLLCSPG
jgi:predicted nucleic acid-binding protein